MSWNSVDGGYDDVQSTAPSSPSIGDTWLDTSTDPPIGKVYADLGGGGEWTTNQLDTTVSSRSSHSWDPNNRVDTTISSRSSHSDPDPSGYIDTTVSSRSSHSWDPQGRIDQPISEAGATQSEVEDAVDSSTTGGRINTTLSSRSSHSDPDPSGYIDQPISEAGGMGSDLRGLSYDQGSAPVDISGSGYLIAVDGDDSASYSGYSIEIDGKQVTDTIRLSGDKASSASGADVYLLPFGSSLYVDDEFYNPDVVWGLE